MSGLAAGTLTELAAGRLPAAVSPALRLDGFGGETYAREPVAALLARYPLRLDDALTVAGATGASIASLAGDVALFADIHAGVVVRLWRLGPAVAAVVPPRFVAVASDDDLTQLRGRVAFDPADHPELRDVAAIAAAAEAVADLDLGLDQPPLRTRVFVRRAFTAGSASAALFGVAVLANGPRRQRLTFNAAALCFPGSAPRLIIDRAGLDAAQMAAWTPQL